MYIKQLYTNCLSQAAYYIESNGEAAIIDPLRETQQYLDLAKERGTTIKYILETHFHADFVSGHLDLANSANAQLVFGSEAKPEYEATFVDDREHLALGDVKIRVIHTPGHTLESVCYVLEDEQGNDHAIFTGDTLFLGDVGRPDLASGDLSQETLASYLYDSLTQKIMPLADEVIVYPGHGAGSACGKKLDDATHSTLGQQKKTNYALQPMAKENFIKAVTDGLEEPPAYFFHDAKLNRQGYQNFEAHLQAALTEKTADQVVAIQNEGALILDTRSAKEFAHEHIPQSMNISLDGRFAPWSGALLKHDTPICIVADEGKAEEAITRLARIGFEHIHGYLKGGISAWKDEGKETSSFIITQEEPKQGLYIDVRTANEAPEKEATNIPLQQLENNLETLDLSTPMTVRCASGYRASTAASILERQGATTISVMIRD